MKEKHRSQELVERERQREGKKETLRKKLKKKTWEMEDFFENLPFP